MRTGSSLTRRLRIFESSLKINCGLLPARQNLSKRPQVPAKASWPCATPGVESSDPQNQKARSGSTRPGFSRFDSAHPMSGDVLSPVPSQNRLYLILRVKFQFFQPDFFDLL